MKDLNNQRKEAGSHDGRITNYVKTRKKNNKISKSVLSVLVSLLQNMSAQGF